MIPERNVYAVPDEKEQVVGQKMPVHNNWNEVHVTPPYYICRTAIISDRVIITDKVTIGPNTVVFYGAMIQGDSAPIIIGEGCCIVDNVTMHNAVELGDFVHLAHGCLVHQRGTEGTLTIGSGTLVGFGAQIHASVGRGCQIAPGVIVDKPVADYRYIYEKRFPGGVRKIIDTPIQAKNYQRVIAMYKNFWSRRTIVKGELTPFCWNDPGCEKYCRTWKEALSKLSSCFSPSISRDFYM